MQNASEKNQLLKQQLRELVLKAQDNQAVLERFQDFELAMLSSQGIGELIDVLLFKSILHFELSDCRLIWFDELQSLRALVQETDRQQCGHRLVFSGLTHEVEQLYVTQKKPILRPLTPVEKLRWFPGRTHVESAAFIPLICRGKLVGSFQMGSPESKRFTADKAFDFMAHMGMIAAMCLQNMAAQEQIRLLSLLDNLTKVKNRRAFDLDINAEVARAQRTQQPLSCLFIDADFFKRINDHYGHQAGDEALRCLAQWAQSQLRETDSIARYGGEEFAVLLPDCDQQLAFDIAERIRLFVQSQMIAFENEEIRLTLSIGVSSFYPGKFAALAKSKIIKALIAQSDAGVYEAKEKGRNRVCFKSFEDASDISTSHAMNQLA